MESRGLVDATRILMTQAGGRNELLAPAKLPTSLNDLAVLAQFMWDFGTQLRIPVWGSHRLCAVTRIPSVFFAADFVRTYTDLATMEAANEAARRAVNGRDADREAGPLGAAGRAGRRRFQRVARPSLTDD